MTLSPSILIVPLTWRSWKDVSVSLSPPRVHTIFADAFRERLGRDARFDVVEACELTNALAGRWVSWAPSMYPDWMERYGAKGTLPVTVVRLIEIRRVETNTPSGAVRVRGVSVDGREHEFAFPGSWLVAVEA